MLLNFRLVFPGIAPRKPPSWKQFVPRSARTLNPEPSSQSNPTPKTALKRKSIRLHSWSSEYSSPKLFGNSNPSCYMTHNHLISLNHNYRSKEKLRVGMPFGPDPRVPRTVIWYTLVQFNSARRAQSLNNNKTRARPEIHGILVVIKP